MAGARASGSSEFGGTVPDSSVQASILRNELPMVIDSVDLWTTGWTTTLVGHLN